MRLSLIVISTTVQCHLDHSAVSSRPQCSVISTAAQCHLDRSAVSSRPQRSVISTAVERSHTTELQSYQEVTRFLHFGRNDKHILIRVSLTKKILSNILDLALSNKI